MIGKHLRKIIRHLLLIFCILNKKKVYSQKEISKIDWNREKLIILLMIPNKEKEEWHYLAVKELSILLYGITSKYKGDFCCLNCLHSVGTRDNLKSHVKIDGCAINPDNSSATKNGEHILYEY